MSWKLNWYSVPSDNWSVYSKDKTLSKDIVATGAQLLLEAGANPDNKGNVGYHCRDWMGFQLLTICLDSKPNCFSFFKRSLICLVLCLNYWLKHFSKHFSNHFCTDFRIKSIYHWNIACTLENTLLIGQDIYLLKFKSNENQNSLQKLLILAQINL